MPMKYADNTRCPDCQAALPAQPTKCPQCHLKLTGPLAIALFGALHTADRNLAAMRVERDGADVPAQVLAPQPAAPSAPAPTGPYAAAPPLIPGQAAQATSTAHTPPTSPGTPAFPTPPPTHTPGGGLSQLTVPKILLGLGALCLLVGALVFLSAAWQWLGVGGRTVVLLAMTGLAGWFGWWLRGRDLRIGAEAMFTVALGLFTLDLAGAANAGWIGLEDGALTALIGLLVGAAAIAIAWLTHEAGDPSTSSGQVEKPTTLVTPQLIAGLALFFGVGGLLSSSEHDATVLTLAVLALIGLAHTAHRVDLGFIDHLAIGSAALWWFGLVGYGLERVYDVDATIRGMWIDLEGAPLAAATLLAVLAGALAGQRGQRLLWATAAVVGSFTLIAPAADDNSTGFLVALSILAVLWACLGRWGPQRLLVPATAAAVVLVIGPALTLVAMATNVLVRLSELAPWTVSAGTSYERANPDLSPLLLPVLLVATVVVVALLVERITDKPAAPVVIPIALGLAALTVPATLVFYAVPIALIAALFTATAVSALIAAAVRDELPPEVLGGVGLGVGVLAVLAGQPSVGLTALVLAALTGACALLALRRQDERAGAVALALVAQLAAGLVWTLGELLDLDEPWRAIPVVLVLAAIALPKPLVAAEVSALAAASGWSLIALEDPESTATTLAIQLTLVGAALTASALLHPSRRLLAPFGGLLLAAATWVRLYDVGVRVPEAYTMPSALVLIALGWWWLRRDPETETLTALLPGLLLATVPSVLRIYGSDPLTLRSLLLGLACLGLVLAGVRLRWTAPLAVGAVVGALVVLRESGPYAADVPPWILIGLAGALLTIVGVTWETRLRDLRSSAAYLARLR